jgi:hypothetical protein
VVVALGGGTALAAPTLMGNVSRGDSNSAAVQACAHGTASDRDARGDCASAAAKSSDTSRTHGQSGSNSDNGSKPSAASNDAHGDAVSAAAKSCAHGTASDRDAHGECVSAVAKSNSTHAGGH